MSASLEELAGKRCGACSGKSGRLEDADVQSMLKALPDWSLDNEAIVKTFNFKNFYETMAFVNAVAWIANREDHHPDLEVSYNKCVVHYSTHSVGGLSDSDFICAAKVEMLSR